MMGTDLLKAAAVKGDLVEIVRLHAEGIDVDQVLEEECCFSGQATALSEACMHGHIECVQKLIELGSDGNRSDDHMTRYKFALEQAAVMGHNLECFRLMLEIRLFKNNVDSCKYHDFISASKTGDFDFILRLLHGNMDEELLEGWKGNNLMSLLLVYGCPPSCLQALIDQGVSVFGFDYNGFTPLMCAVLAENVKCVNFLCVKCIRFYFSLGGSINVSTMNFLSYFVPNGKTDKNLACVSSCQTESMYLEKSYATALMYASCLESTDCLLEMLEFLSYEEINFYFESKPWTALTYAAYFGNTDSVSLLIKYSARVDIRCLHDCTTLQIAITSRSADCLELLLKCAPVQCITSIISDFSLCVYDVNCLRVLLKCMKDINFINDDTTLLMEAAENKAFECVRLLTDNGADIHFRNYSRETVLMLCCHDDSGAETLDYLLRKGADINAADDYGKTAIMHAACTNSVKCLLRLRDHGVNVDSINQFTTCTPLMTACEHDCTEFVDSLLKCGANFEIRDKNGFTVVNYTKSVKILQLLMDHRADIHLTNHDGMTLLMTSCKHQCNEIVDFLIRQGIDLNAQDKKGWTATMYACGTNSAKVSCLQLMLSGGADLEVVESTGHTVFSYAMTVDRSPIDVLLQSEKIVSNGILKSEHKRAITMAGMRGSVCNFKNVLTAIKHGVFEWGWCFINNPLSIIAHSFVGHGICPGKLAFPYCVTSLLHMAFIRADIQTIKYLLTTRYFFPEDYRAISSNITIKDSVKHNSALAELLEQLTCQPLSLQTWSFLTISKAVSLAGRPTGRASRVDALPLPEILKTGLTFSMDVCKVCCSQWETLPVQSVFDSLNFSKEIPENSISQSYPQSCQTCNGKASHFVSQS